MDRANLQKEVASLSSEIDRIAESANFNGIKLLNGDLGKKSTGLSDTNGNINVADGITINAPVDGAGKKHAMEITISAGLFNEGDKIDMTVVDADGNEKAVSLEFNAGAVSANGQFKGTTAEEQAQGIADAINAKYTGDGKELEGYTASAAVDAETGEMKITLTANEEGAGKLSLKTGENGKINITDKRVGIPTDGGITPTPGVDTTATASVTGLGTTIVPLGFDTAGSALDINEGDTLKFSLNVNGQDQTVTLKAVSGTAALGQNEFRVGNGQHLADVLNNIKETLATATFDNAEGTKAIDESKLKVSDFFNVGTEDNALTFSTKPGIPNNAGITNYGVSGIKLYAAGTGSGVDAVPTGATTGAMNGLTIKSDTTNHSLSELADGDTITISGVNKDGGTFEVQLTAKTTAGAAGEFTIGADETTTLNSIVTALKDANTVVSFDGGATTAAGNAFFHDSTGQFKITANTFSGQINFETLTDTAPTDATKANSVVKFENAYNEGDKFTIRGTLRDGSSFSVELTATNKTGDLANNEFKIGANLDETLDNIKAVLENSNTEVRINDASSTVKGGDIFGDGKEITIVSPRKDADGSDGSNTAAQLTFESVVAGKVGKGGASGVGDVTVNASAEMKAAASTKEPGKEAGKASNTLTFDADKIEQGTTLTIGGNTYEFVTDEKYLSKDGPEGNIAITVADLGKKDADGNTIVSDEDIAKAVYKALTGTAAAETGDTSKDLVGAKDENGRPLVDGSGNAIYKVNYAAGSNSITIESVASGTGAEALKDVAISSTKQDTSVVKFTTTTEGYGNNKKTTLNVKAGDSVTIEGKTYEFVEAGKRTKDENAIAVELDFAGTAKDAADALAKAVNDTTVAATDKSYNVLATANNDGSITLVSRFNPNVKAEDAYAAPKVEVSKTAGGLTLQVGETSEDFQKVNVAIDKMDAKSLGIGDINVGTQEGAAAAIDKIKTAINTVSSTRGDLGAIQNRLEHTINNLGVTTENMTAAESRIRDTDMAKEMMEFTKNNILVQASQAMLAQANQLPQGVLQLLQ